MQNLRPHPRPAELQPPSANSHSNARTGVEVGVWKLPQKAEMAGPPELAFVCRFSPFHFLVTHFDCVLFLKNWFKVDWKRRGEASPLSDRCRSTHGLWMPVRTGKWLEVWETSQPGARERGSGFEDGTDKTTGDRERSGRAVLGRPWGCCRSRGKMEPLSVVT